MINLEDIKAEAEATAEVNAGRSQYKTYLTEAARIRLELAAAYAGVPMSLLMERLILEELPAVQRRVAIPQRTQT